MPINAEDDRQGFTTISNEFLWDPGIGPFQKLILIRLATAPERGDRTAKEIAATLGIAYTTAQIHLRALERSRRIIQDGRGRKNQVVYKVQPGIQRRVQP